MRAASLALATLINSGVYLDADCFTLTLQSGFQFLCSSKGATVNIGGRMFPGGSTVPQITGLKYSVKLGLSVDEQDVTLIASSANLLEGVPWLKAIGQGALDGARLQRERAFMTAGGWNTVAVGSLVLFSGRVSSIENLGRTQATIKVKSELVQLDRDFPRNYWQPTCNKTLYSLACGASRAANTVSGTIAAGGSPSLLVLAGAGSDLSPYVQGNLTMTSGATAGSARTVMAVNSAPAAGLDKPLLAMPAVGDSFTLSKGCDHTPGAAGCARFANLANFLGFTDVPNTASGL